MTKRFFTIQVAMLMALIWIVGCSSFPGLKSTRAKRPEGNLYNKVPASMRAQVKEASFDLKEAHSNLKLAEKKVTLADLKKERAILAKKQADFGKKMAETLVKKAEVTMERKKLEAIDNANLGDKGGNIKSIANLRTRELSVESEGIKTKAEIDTLELKIRALDKKIAAQARRVASKKK